MQKNINIAASKHLTLDEIRGGRMFPHRHVLDLRCNANGKSRPVEEGILRRLANHFISYDQLPLDQDLSTTVAEEKLMAILDHKQGDILVLTDCIAQVANLCVNAEIPFKSKDFYIVETGRGDVVKHTQPISVVNVRFGSFVG